MTTSTCHHPATSGKKTAGIFQCITGWAGRCHPARRGWFALGIALAAAGSGAAAPVENAGAGSSSATLNKLGDDELLVEEVFQSHLPTTLQKYALRLSVHPHLGDWQKKDHMRMSTTLRYGLTENCEISAASNLYFSHGHGDIRAFDSYGAANLKLGAKLNLGQFIFSGWETAAGFEYDFPTGHPAPELTDGLRHFRPYVTLSHRLESHPDLRIFVGFRLDGVTKTSLPGEFGKNAFQETSTGITGGMVIDRDRWHYTFEASYDTTRLIIDHGEDIFSFRPGVLWEIPARGHSQFRSNWMIGVALNNTYGPGGSSLGASFKLRYSSDLKQQLRRHRSAPAP
jgi:hypothetical protein